MSITFNTLRRFDPILSLSAAAIILTAVLCVALPMVSPQSIEYATSTSIINEDGLFEQTQWPWLAGGVIILALTTWRTKTRQRWATAFYLFIYVLLCWREIDFDKHILGDRWYDIGSYVVDAEIPVSNRIVLSLLFLVATLNLYAILRRFGALKEFYRTRLWLHSHVLLGVVVLFFGLATLLDRSSSIQNSFGISLDFTLKFYIEECLELLGCVAAFFAALAIARCGVKDDAQSGNAKPEVCTDETDLTPFSDLRVPLPCPSKTT